VKLSASSKLTSSSAKAVLTFTAANDQQGTPQPWIVIGSADSSRVELYQAHASLAAAESLAANNFEYKIEAGADKATLWVDFSDADGFLTTTLGSTKPQNIELPATIGWSSRTGFTISGQTQLSATIPVRITIANALRVDTASIGLVAGGDPSTAALQLGFSGSLALGPIDASIDNVGVQVQLRNDTSGGGNLGDLDFQFGFKSPSGVALALDAGVVAGSGFLSFDAQKGQYTGAIQLELGTLSLAAIGLLTTKLRDGSPILNSDGTPGYSLLIIITATFPPIQVGFGFALDGVGGLLGLNRTMNVDALRAGVRNRAVDSTLMPADPLHNASQIVTGLGNMFPVAMGRFLVGPLARLSWGTPPLMVLDLAILVEVPEPMKVAILGRIRVALPEDNDIAIVLIRLDVLGVLDFDQGTVSIDATIYDSTIAGFALSGDMALRAGWKNNPQFALSLGGFNPGYEVPPGFPSLRRLALSLSSGDNPRIRFETYLAVTSNTMQCGARVDLHAAAEGFAIDGMLAFDALIHINPFGLVVDFGAMVAVTYQGSVIAGVSLWLHVKGPGPWEVSGKARVQVLCFSATVAVGPVTLGQGAPAPSPSAVDVSALLTQAISESANWSALPPPGDAVITLRSRPADNIIRAHPFGSLTFRQRTVPLGVHIEKYGDAPVSGADEFTITSVQLGSKTLSTPPPIMDEFAPGQFLNLSDAEELSQPSFEAFESGFQASFDDTDFDDQGANDAEPLGYQLMLVDQPGVTTSVPPPTPIAPNTMLRMAKTSPAAFAPNPRVATRRFAGAPLGIRVLDHQYAVANALDASSSSALKTAGSWTETAQALRQLSSQSSRKLQVIRI
jgi:hypothetical protein